MSMNIDTDAGEGCGFIGCGVFVWATSLSTLWLFCESIPPTILLAATGVFLLTLLVGWALAYLVDVHDTWGDSPRTASRPAKSPSAPPITPLADRDVARAPLPSVFLSVANALGNFRATAVKRYDERVKRFDERTKSKE